MLHVVVREHLETFLATFRAQHGKSLLRYVEQSCAGTFGAACSLMDFCEFRVRAAGRRCWWRSSASAGPRARAAARVARAAAAHLVDEVLPDVGVRQWVLTTPPEVRHVLAVRPEALTAHARIFVEEIGRWQKEQARARAPAAPHRG